MGYTEHHIAFGLMHLFLLGYVVHFRQRVPGLVCGILSVSAIIIGAGHAVMGGMCHSRAISHLMHAHLPTFPVVRLCMARTSIRTYGLGWGVTSLFVAFQ